MFGSNDEAHHDVVIEVEEELGQCDRVLFQPIGKFVRIFGLTVQHGSDLKIWEKVKLSFMSIDESIISVAIVSLKIITAEVFISRVVWIPHSFLKNGPTQASFRLFSVFSNKQYNFYNKSMWKDVHPVYGTGIRTHDLTNISRHPLPQDQGSGIKI